MGFFLPLKQLSEGRQPIVSDSCRFKKRFSSFKPHFSKINSTHGDEPREKRRRAFCVLMMGTDGLQWMDRICSVTTCEKEKEKKQELCVKKIHGMCGIHLHVSRRLVLVQQLRDGGQRVDKEVALLLDGRTEHDCDDDGVVQQAEEGVNNNAADDDDEEEEEERICTTTTYPEWLRRRGPDHQGYFFEERTTKLSSWWKNDARNDATTTTTRSKELVRVKLSLQASVLNMRQHVVRQPVAIAIRKQQQAKFETAEQLSSRRRTSNDNDDTIHLCWNGEVYQEERPQQQTEKETRQQMSSETHEMLEQQQQQQQQHHDHRHHRRDVWRFQESDTNLVALRLQEALNSFLTPASKQVHSNPPAAGNDNNNNNNNTMEKKQVDNDSSLLAKDDDDDARMFHAVHQTMSSLVNAEFAYCITTSSCVYYGKDRWGCRSLLTGRRRTSSSNSKDDDEDDDDDGTLLTTTKTTDAAAYSDGDDWYLSSVANTTETTSSRCGGNTTTTTCSSEDDCIVEWTEVLPGIVFEYNFMTNQTRSLPLTTVALLQTPPLLFFDIMATTRTATTTTIMATCTTTATLNNNDHAARATTTTTSGRDDECYNDKKKSNDGAECSSRRHDNDDENVSAIHPDDDSDNDELAPSRQLYALLRQAVRRRYTGPCTILFSGGLDSVVLAALALQRQQELLILQQQQEEDQQQQAGRDYSIVLVNISFLDDDDEKGNTRSRKTTQPVAAADTQAALASYHELQRLFPNAKFEYIQRQVTYKQVAEHEEHIRKLIHPKQSTMDLNIATALWFAAQSTTTTSSSSSSSLEHRILLTGLGADELMGGYGRHRKAYQRGGVSALRDELHMDQERLWERNLGRDDRVLSDHGKEARFPYLDCDVVQYLSSLAMSSSSSSCSSLCDFSLPPGQGDKRILRLVACHFLHLSVASAAVKRAIQFGSRISHVCDKRRFGSRRKAKGETSALKFGASVAHEKAPT